MSEISMIGLDLAKNVFQVHGVDASGTVVVRRQLRRAAVEKFFAQLPPCMVGMEACGSAHHWARVIGGYGHQVRLMPPAYVKPYVKRNKNDGRDAEAICEAVGRPSMRFVPVKSVEQQATLAVHGTRALLVRQRTMAANALRAALSEIGIVAAQGLDGLRELMARLEAPGTEIPEIMRGALLVLARHWQALDADERALERQIAKTARADHEARRLMEVPGVGPIIASTVLAKVPDATKTVTAIIGPSGCGKSTLLRSLNRLHDLVHRSSSRGKGAVIWRRDLRAGHRPGPGPAAGGDGFPEIQSLSHHVHSRECHRGIAPQRHA